MISVLLFDDVMMSALIHPPSLTVSAGFLPLGPTPAQIRCIVSSCPCLFVADVLVGLNAAGQLIRDDQHVLKGIIVNVQFD